MIRIGHGRCENCYSMSCRGCVMRIHNNGTVMDAYYIIALHRKIRLGTLPQAKRANLQIYKVSMRH